MSDPLDGIEEPERTRLQEIAKAEGLTLAEVRRQLDILESEAAKAVTPRRDELEDAAAEEATIVSAMQAVGINVRGRWQAVLAARRGQQSERGGRKGGSQSKRRKWAEWAASQVTRWEDLPGPDRPLEYGMAGDIYKDGNRIIFGGDGVTEESLARSTFEKRYLK